MKAILIKNEEFTFDGTIDELIDKLNKYKEELPQHCEINVNTTAECYYGSCCGKLEIRAYRHLTEQELEQEKVKKIEQKEKERLRFMEDAKKNAKQYGLEAVFTTLQEEK